MSERLDAMAPRAELELRRRAQARRDARRRAEHRRDLARRAGAALLIAVVVLLALHLALSAAGPLGSFAGP